MNDLKEQNSKISPPNWLLRFFRWFCHPDYQEDIEGDLLEMFHYRVEEKGSRRAKWIFFFEVFSLIKINLIRTFKDYHITSISMYKNYFKIAWRNLLSQKLYSILNIGGLAIGIAIAMLIALWIYDEFSYNKHHPNYAHLAQVKQHSVSNGVIRTGSAIPRPLENELRTNYAQDFKYISMLSWTGDHLLNYGEHKLSRSGNFAQVDFPEMLSLKMLKGTRYGLKGINSVLLSKSTADALFKEEEPIGKIIDVDGEYSVKVTGVYEDLPHNTTFSDLEMILPWDLWVSSREWVELAIEYWDNNSFQMCVQIPENGNFAAISERIKDIKAKHLEPDFAKRMKPELFLQAMSDWHLYSEFKNGKNVGGRIKYVWLYGLIGVFVLMLACINFMNLNTARSEKRAKEVGIRKVIGSLKGQLIQQFLVESILVSLIAFILALNVVNLSLPFFNDIADKKIQMPWGEPYFWLFGLSFTLLTGLISGSYPAFYLSSFQPIKVIKGTYRAGAYASLPRKVLVVLQFTVSITLIVGTIVVYNQIQFSKSRPLGYDREGIVSVFKKSRDFQGKFNVLQAELTKTNAIVNMAEASSPMTGIWSNWGGFDWDGRTEDQDPSFRCISITHDYGKTIGWNIIQGRDFSRDFPTDSSAIILNEAAAKFIGVENPIGMKITRNDDVHTVIGVVRNVLMESPYRSVTQGMYFLDYNNTEFVHLKLNPQKTASESLASIQSVFNKVIPNVPFDYVFVENEFAEKFSAEERIGKLSGVFALLAIFISCLGLFGLASYMAERRAKEISIRRILGASIYNLWKMLSRDFLILVIISFFIASPIAYYFLQNWLENYEYRTHISWWIFVWVGINTILITLLTVSFQSIKAASAKPVDILRNE